MQQVDFQPLGRSVSCLGLGCARLDGRVGLKRSTRLIETALKLGITYFDIAGSYGTAEEAIGHVIGNSSDVVITTKVGPPRPPYNARKMLLKEMTRPVLDRVRGLKVWLRGPTPTAPRADRPRYDFSQERIRNELEQSLTRLKRDRVELLLAHEPHREDLNSELSQRFQSLVNQDLVGNFGAGVDVREDQWAPFGSVWQSGWPGNLAASYHRDVSYIFHGVLRYAEKNRRGETLIPPYELIRQARQIRPDAVLLVSASTPGRLRQLVEGVEL